MPAARCENCGSRLPARSRFCPECGVRVGARDDTTAAQEVPPEETGPVPVHVTTATPGYFGVAPKLLTRASREVLGGLRARAGSAVEILTAHSTGRMELFRLRRELGDLMAARAETMRLLGEAVYGGDEEATETGRARAAELDEHIAAKEAEMAQIAAAAEERIQRAQLQLQPTEVLPEPEPGPMPVPEPAPVPSEPAQPIHIPEPGPVPSEPPAPVHVPEPAPEPVPEPTPPPAQE